MRTPHRLGTALLTCLILTSLTLTGCSSVEPDPRPDIVWPDGEPTGPLEDDLWVQAVRTSTLEVDIAIATRDFSGTALRDTAPEIRRGARHRLEDAAHDKEWVFAPGPRPMIPIHVDEAPDGKSATVIVCRASGWYITAETPDPPTDPIGLLDEIEVTLEEGHRRVDLGVFLNEDVVIHRSAELAKAAKPFLDPRDESDCLLDDAPRGYFDPPPDVTLEYSPDDIK